MISTETLKLAHEALRNEEVAVRAWAMMPDEESARSRHRQVRSACQELSVALRERGS